MEALLHGTRALTRVVAETWWRIAVAVGVRRHHYPSSGMTLLSAAAATLSIGHRRACFEAIGWSRRTAANHVTGVGLQQFSSQCPQQLLHSVTEIANSYECYDRQRLGPAEDGARTRCFHSISRLHRTQITLPGLAPDRGSLGAGAVHVESAVRQWRQPGFPLARCVTKGSRLKKRKLAGGHKMEAEFRENVLGRRHPRANGAVLTSAVGLLQAMTNQGKAQNTANISLHSLGQVVDPWYPLAPLPMSSWLSYEGWQQRLFNWRTMFTRFVRNTSTLGVIWKSVDGFSFHGFRQEVWATYKAVQEAAAAEDYNVLRQYTTPKFQADLKKVIRRRRDSGWARTLWETSTSDKNGADNTNIEQMLNIQYDPQNPEKSFIQITVTIRSKQKVRGCSASGQVVDGQDDAETDVEDVYVFERQVPDKGGKWLVCAQLRSPLDEVSNDTNH
eukprot:scaffold1588_cov408-Prasinococcus_capsulatus_cf.AAC.8